MRAHRHVTAALLIAVACGGETTQPPVDLTPITPAHIDAAGSKSFASTTGAVLTATVVVTNAYGAALANIPITFAVNAGAGNVSPSTAMTDAGGRASTAWTLGPIPGVQLLGAAAPRLPFVEFDALAASRVDGTWDGTVNGTTITITMKETAGIVSGTGVQAPPGSNSRAFTLKGTYEQPTIAVTASSAGFPDFNIQGTLSATAITGVLNGAGYANTAIVMRKR